MRIGIVNDLPLAREALILALEAGRHQVAWVAADGLQAVQECARDQPDLVLMDLIMPNMDGAEATREIMAQTPCPILVVTASVTGNSELVYEAMGHGALDATTTPTIGPDGQAHAEALLGKIEQMSYLIGHHERVLPREHTRLPFAKSVDVFPPFLAIGASTGGPQALATILGDLPGDFPAAIGIVQHVDAEFAQGLADWLDQRSNLEVTLARDREHARPAHIYLSAGDRHLRIDSIGRFIYTDEPTAAVNRPSVNVFFKSLAYAYPKPGCALLLTGMGRDGAEGLKAMRESGWQTFAQDQASSIVYGMPKAAAELDAAVSIRPLNEMSRAIKGYFEML